MWTKRKEMFYMQANGQQMTQKYREVQVGLHHHTRCSHQMDLILWTKETLIIKTRDIYSTVFNSLFFKLHSECGNRVYGEHHLKRLLNLNKSVNTSKFYCRADWCDSTHRLLPLRDKATPSAGWWRIIYICSIWQTLLLWVQREDEGAGFFGLVGKRYHEVASGFQSQKHHNIPAVREILGLGHWGTGGEKGSRKDFLILQLMEKKQTVNS